MKKGKVNANMLYLKRGGYIHKGGSITSDDVPDFDQLVEKGHIVISKSSKAKADADAKAKADADAKKVK